MNHYKRSKVARRHLLVLALLLAAFVIPHTLPAETPKAELCVSDLCDGDSIRDVLNRNLHKQVQVVLRSGVELTGTVNKVSGSLVQLTNLTHRNFFDAVVDFKEIGAVVMRVRTTRPK
ncbi:MAG TPA: hypothetical protein VKB51_07950 [bacterium]|nr:hypothetical protein [bacterium]